ncbi:MAG: SpoIIE family protein phosphatase [Spirochaetota bacterium]
MKIKYKIIILMVIVIIVGSLPLSLYILGRESDEKISLLIDQGIMNSRMLSRSALNIILMNGGDIKAASVDAGEMISMLAPLKDTGLIYADAVLVSNNPEYNGYVLASIRNEEKIKDKSGTKNISYNKTAALTAKEIFEEEYIPDFGGYVYKIISTSSVSGKNFKCAGRLFFSKSAIYSNINRLRHVAYVTVIISMLITIGIGLILGRFISGPIETLINEVEIIGSGDLDHHINIKGKDEIGKLATTFNHLAQVLKLEINHLRNKNIELERINNLKDDFLANVTHELRTPLYGMTGLAESLIDGVAGDLEEKAKYNLSLMISSGKRLSSLVNDILDYSQLKHSDIPLNLTSINLHSIVKLIISICTPLIENKELIIRTNIEPDSFFVYADENRLQQILLNLVGNAVKFTESGEIMISANASSEIEDEVVVSIRDTGIGIVKEDQERIFELFEQAGGSISKYKTGTGIGLSISRQLVELHGGKIKVDSEAGKGACFSFTLKRSDRKTILIKDRSMKYVPDLQNNNESPVFDDEIIPQNVDPNNKLAYSKVMIVDDEPVNCQILINYLYMEDYIIIPVANGQEALNKINNGHVPDLLILDVMLPVMSGYEVCKKIREKYSSGELPVIMLTAKTSPDDMIIGFEAGTNDYLTKPVGKAELLARVNGLLQLRRSVQAQAKLSLIKREMNIAHSIQTSLLENKMPDIENASLALRYYPMYEIGGDFYEISQIDENRISILLADVSGHGIPAAFISGMLKVICNFHSKNAQNPAEFLNNINEAIYNLVEEQFITACYAIIDFKERKITQANAGHWPILLYRQNTNELIINEENGMPLGCTPEEKYKNSEYDLQVNDRLIFYTDGVIEIKNTERKIFGAHNFHMLIKATGNYELEKFTDKIIETIKRWYNVTEPVFADDVTLLALDIKKFNS